MRDSAGGPALPVRGSGHGTIRLHSRPVSVVEVSVGKTPVGERLITRAYSICSPPSGNRFELCLNRVKDGLLSPGLFELQPGDEVAIKGPVGYFTIRRPESDLVMVAAGTGIAPLCAR